jgi:hypothetical protein
MTDTLEKLLRFLAKDPLGVADVAARIGPIVHDPGPPLEIDLAPSVPGVRAAHLSRYPDTGAPYTLRVELASPVSVAALRAAFGEYRQMRTDRGVPREIAFYPPSTEPRWSVAVLARIPPGAAPIDEAHSSEVTFRRDPR